MVVSNREAAVITNLMKESYPLFAKFELFLTDQRTRFPKTVMIHDHMYIGVIVTLQLIAEAKESCGTTVNGCQTPMVT